MRKLFSFPSLVGMLASGAAQAFAQSATVVMRNGDRVQAKPENHRSTAPANARSVVVPSNVVWTNTGINVRAGKTCASSRRAKFVSALTATTSLAPPVP